MSTVLVVEVRRNAFRWAVLLAGEPTFDRWSPIASYRWKFQAVIVGRFYARMRSEQQHAGDSVELIIKNRNGRIAEKNTYGYDPESSVG